MQLQLIFDKIAEKKQEAKLIQQMYKDGLNGTDDYQEIGRNIKELRAKRKEIESSIQKKLGKAWEKGLELKEEIKKEKVLMNDVAVSNLMDGKTVELTDAFQNIYQPEWSVKFKKVNEVKKEQ